VPKETCCTKSGRGHIVAFNILNAGASAGRFRRRRFEARADDLRKVIAKNASVWQQIGEFGLIRKSWRKWPSRFFAVESMVYRSGGTIEACTAALPVPATRFRTP